MRLHLIIVLFLTFASLSFGQTPTPSASPAQSASPEKSRTKIFGSSLKKYETNGHFKPNKQSDDSDDGETIRVKTNLVVNDILVTDQNGRMITNLTKDDFIVTEDGAAQTIEMFSFGENTSLSRSFVLVIDYGGFQFPYLKNSIEAAKLLVDKLNPQDKMAIVSDDVKLLVDFTQDKTLLKKTLDSIKKKPLQTPLGKGNEFSALLAVLNEMFAAEDSHRIIIFQGAGSEIVTLKPDNDTPYQISKSTLNHSRIRYESERKFGFSDIKEAIERSRATIYSIITEIRFLGFSKEEQLARAKISLENFNRSLDGSDGDLKRKAYLEALVKEFQPSHAEWMLAAQIAMFKVAELSGGKTGFIEKPEDAETVYSTIFNLISTRYAIGYYPTNQARDGRRREVKIEVRDHPEYIVTGRKAYFPQ